MRTPALALALALAALAGCSSLISTPRGHIEVPPEELDAKFSPAELREDLQSLVDVVAEVHPQPYAVASADELAVLVRVLGETIDRPMTRLEFWPLAARLAAAFGDAHTTVGPPSEEFNAFVTGGGKLLPIAIDERDGRWWITRNHHEDLARLTGCELVRVNGIDFAALARKHAALRAGDPAFVTSVFERSFYWHLWEAGARAPYTVEAARGARVVEALLPGLDVAEITARSQSRPAVAPWSLAWLDGDVALIDFRSMQDQPRWDAFLESTFTELESRGARGLIVDLRQNGGGNSSLGNALLAYVNRSPYRMCARKEWRSSARYRRYMKEHVTAWLRWLPLEELHSFGRRFWGVPEGELVIMEGELETPEPQEPQFDGPWCLLIGPGTFSSAMMLANAVEDYRLAPLFGEPTGGVPNAFGEVYPCDLPHTRLSLGVSSAYFVRANGDGEDPRPVLPTHPVTPGRRGRDSVLDAARAWVRSQAPPPTD